MRLDLLEPLLRGGRPAIVARIHVQGFLYGWKCFLVMDPGLTAALAVGMASYVGYIVHLSSVGAKTAAIAAVVALAAANILGVRLGARLLRSLAVLKIVSLAFLILRGVLGRFGDWGNLLPFAHQRPGSESLVVLLLVLIAGHDPKQALLGVAVVGLGLPVYELVVRKRR